MTMLKHRASVVSAGRFKQERFSGHTWQIMDYDFAMR